MDILQPIVGVALMLSFAYLISESRQTVAWKWVASGIAVQFVLALLLLKIPVLQHAFSFFNDVVLVLDTATQAGTSFVFGYLGGGDLPFVETHPGASFILAFKALPIVLLMSALSALLYYWRILPWVITALSQLFIKTLRLGGALSFGAAANVFLGMVESPLLLKPYLNKLSRGELFALMSCGMATVAGTVLLLYATILAPVVPDALGHIIVASILSIPAALTIARIMVPWHEQNDVAENNNVAFKSEHRSAMEALTTGTLSGVPLLINIIALLIVLVALVTLCNEILALFPSVYGESLTLQRMLGWCFAPIAWLIGIPWSETFTAGSLLGTKVILNEFIAYLNMAQLSEGELSVRSTTILTYALCGFANIGSLGIMIGGLTTLVPERKHEVIQLGAKTIVAGMMATLMTGAVVAILL